MLLVSEVRKCSACGKKYSFNPDNIRGIICPYCRGFGKIKTGLKRKPKKGGFLGEENL